MRTRRQQRAARRVQAWWRRNLALPMRDPISHGLLRRPVVALGGTLFSAHALADYVRTTGDTLHPITREALGQADLRRIARAAGTRIDAGELARRFKRRREAASLCTALETDVLRALDSLLRELCEDETCAVVYRRLLQHFPVFTGTVARLHDVDADAAHFVLRRSQTVVRRARPKRRVATWMLVRDYVDDLARVM